MEHRRASVEQVVATLRRLASGRPDPRLVLAWVRTTVHDEDLVDSKEVAHTFRCDEAYVCWCVELGVRRGDIVRRVPPWRLVGVPAPLEAWARSPLDPLARLALEGAFDDELRRIEDGRDRDER